MKFLDKYNVTLINERYHNNRTTYDVKINSEVITDYAPSPMLTSESEMITDAMAFVTSVASEWIYSQRNDDNDNFFENIYNQLHNVISDDDIMELHYELESNEDN